MILAYLISGEEPLESENSEERRERALASSKTSDEDLNKVLSGLLEISPIERLSPLSSSKFL